jgi:hypothetical protein
MIFYRSFDILLKQSDIPPIRLTTRIPINIRIIERRSKKMGGREVLVEEKLTSRAGGDAKSCQLARQITGLDTASNCLEMNRVTQVNSIQIR